MRIIKHGDKFEIGETTCPTCHCIFAYTREDVNLAYNKDESHNRYFISCPECFQNLYISAKEIEI